MIRPALPILAALAAGVAPLAPAAAQIATDGSLGPAQIIEGQLEPEGQLAFEIPSDVGRLSGDLLLFSFSEFGVPDDASATFTPSAGLGTVDTVLSRVTGGEPSEIRGALRSELGEQHFYLLNPWGVFFGPDSSLSVGGAFHVTTADELRDGLGNRFSAREPGAEVLIARPESFGFLSPEPAAIRVEGELAVARDAGLDLIGGDLTLSGARLSAPSGQVRFVSLAGPAAVEDRGGILDVVSEPGAGLGAIELLDGSIVSVSALEPPDATPAFAGTPEFLQETHGIALITRRELLEPGDVIIGQDASGDIVGVLRAPEAGEFSAHGRSLLIRDSDVRARSFGPAGGRLRVETTESVVLEKSGAVEDVGLLARSEAVEVHVEEQTIEFPGTGIEIFYPEATHTLQAVGDGVPIEIRTGALQLSGGAVVTATTLAEGRGGAIDVVAEDSVQILGVDSGPDAAPTALFSNSQGSGDAGDISVETRKLRLEAGGAIIAQTEGNGDAGDIRVDVRRLDILDFSQIDSSSSAFSLLDGDGEPPTTGNGGDLDIRASRSIRISGRVDELDFARLSTFAQQRTEGRAGSIRVSTPRLEVSDGGGIAATTRGAGDGGDLRLDVGTLRLSSGGGLLVNSTATAAELDGRAPGASGSIQIGVAGGEHPTREVWLRAAEITALAQEGPGELEPREGNIAIDARQLVVLRDGSAVTASVGEGRGGDVSVSGAELLVLEGGSALLAETADGRGGAIALDSEGLAPELARLGPSVLESADFESQRAGGRVSADAGTGSGGVVSAGSPEIDVESQVRAPDVAFLDPSSRLRRVCAARASGEGGSFQIASDHRSTGGDDEDWLAGAEITPLGSGEVEASASRHASQARRALAGEDLAGAVAELESAERALARLEARPAARLALHLAESRARLARRSPALREASLQRAFQLLADNVEHGNALRSPALLSLALGRLGSLYEDEGRIEEALYLTRQALSYAEDEGSGALAYRWHAQEGRLLWALGRSDAALHAFGRAVAALETVRLGGLPREGDFGQAIAPVYLDYVDALLASSDRVDPGPGAERLLVEARAVMEQFKAAELRDHFRDDCIADLEHRTLDLDRVLRERAPRAAVVYPVALDDRLELLVSLHDGLVRRRVEVGRDALREVVGAFRAGLSSPVGRSYREPARRLFDWLVAPYADELASRGIDTLVFVPDALLRTVPLSALHDGEGFLIERYAVAVTPGLSLIDPRKLEPGDERFLLAGLSAGTHYGDTAFQPLPNVPREIQSIRDLYGGDVLLDRDFEAARFERALVEREPTVVHVASHAVFTGDPSASYLVAADRPITLDELGALVAPRRYTAAPLGLLVLSACETASGDEDAALGLAGIAVRSGARSALGSLWAVSDEATYRVISGFYRELDAPQASKARALRRAQLALVGSADRSFRHPYYWAAFLLISDWL